MFFKTNSTKVTLREYLFEGPLLLKPVVGLIAVVSKLFRIRIPGSVDFPPVDRLSMFRINSGAMPSEFMDATVSERQTLEREGFTLCAELFINDVTHSTRYAGFVFCSADRRTIAWVRVRRWPNLPAKSKTTRVQFSSVAGDGQVIVTTSANRDLLEPPSWSVIFHEGLEPSKLFHIHRDLLTKNSLPPKIFETTQDVLEQLDQLQTEFSRFQTSRGVFEPQAELNNGAIHVPGTALLVTGKAKDPEVVLTPDGTAASQRSDLSLFNTNAADSQAANAEDLIIAEVRKQETKQTNLLSKLILLGVSVLAFVIAGGAVWDWTFALLLIPILLLHELGHLLAMKLFGYKNVKMFFIPFLGAAVTGRHYNVEGWKKAFVSLAGPVPSICIAIVLEILGFVLQVEWMTQAALIMLLLNLFNLLPFLPLDGGWVAHVTLFSRSKYLDISFRVIAILAMFAASLWMDGKFMMYLGIAMAVSLPAVWRTLKVREKLALVELPPASGDFIPEEAIRKISQACLTANLPANNSSQLAATTIEVYLSVNAKPPGWPATIGLWFIHGGAVAVGILGLLGLAAGEVFKKFGELTDLRHTDVVYSIPRDDIEYREGTSALPQTAMLLWQFSDQANASEGFKHLSSTSSDSLVRVGAVVMASTQGKDAKSFDDNQTFSDLLLRPTEDEKEARSDNRLESIPSQLSASEARLFCNSLGPLPTINVEFDKPESLNKVMLELNAMPVIEFDKQPIAPWTPNQKLTTEQARLRRLLNVLTENEEKLPWLPEANPTTEDMNEELSAEMSESERRQAFDERIKLMEAQQAEDEERKLSWIKAGLARSSGETKKMTEAYLQYDAALKSALKKSETVDDGEQVTFPALHEYLADSAKALGFVEIGEPAYRFGARVNAFPQQPPLDSMDDLVEEPFSLQTNKTETKLILSVHDVADSCAFYRAVVQWLFQQGAVSVSLSYSKLELEEDALAKSQ